MDSSPRLNVAAMANRSRSVSVILGLTLATTVLLACVASSSRAAITWTGGIYPSNPTKWTSDTDGYIGDLSTGEITVDDASVLLSYSGYVGCNSGSTGSVTVTGSGSKWTNSRNLYVGYVGSGTLTVSDGGSVVAGGGIYSSLSSLSGDGTILANGGVLDADLVFDAAHGSQDSLIFGSGGILTITPSASNELGVGYKGTGTLRIADGVSVTSSSGLLGYHPGSTGTAVVTGSGTKWTMGKLYVGRSGSGALTVSDGGTVVSDNLFASLSSLQGNGTISATGGILDADLVFDAAHGLTNSLSFGSGGTLTFTQSSHTLPVLLGVGYHGTGTLRIADGVKVAPYVAWLGHDVGSMGTAVVTGSGSTWNWVSCTVGLSGTGILTIEAGGQVRSDRGISTVIGLDHGSTGTITVTGNGSKLAMYDSMLGFTVGYSGTGTLNIGSGIASDGLVVTESLELAEDYSAKGTCNLNGGTLQVGAIYPGKGAATFNWYDGIIRNYVGTDLTVYTYTYSSFTLKLAATGTHAFYIDRGHAGTVNAVLSDATSGGTLAKLGEGTLTLAGANTYTGKTTVSAGSMKLASSGSLASVIIDVQSGATFDVRAISNYSLGAGKSLTGSGTVLGNLSVNGIHAPGNSVGIETVIGNYSLLGELQIELAGATAGSGYDQVLQSGLSAYSTTTLSGTLTLDWTGFGGSVDSTKLWILKNDTHGTLSGTFGNYANGASLGVHDGRSWCLFYGANFATGSLTGGNDVVISVVPEPGMMGLLGIFAMGVGLVGWRRRTSTKDFQLF